jgi:hypothetical protein
MACLSDPPRCVGRQAGSPYNRLIRKCALSTTGHAFRWADILGFFSPERGASRISSWTVRHNPTLGASRMSPGCQVRIAHIFPTPSLHLDKYDQDSAWDMPRSNCPHFPDGPACTWPSTTRIGLGECHDRIAHVFPTPRLNLAKYDQDWAWVMPHSNCQHFPDGPACTRPSATWIGRGKSHVRIAHISRLPSLHLAKNDQDLAWEMPRSNCQHFPDSPA